MDIMVPVKDWIYNFDDYFRGPHIGRFEVKFSMVLPLMLKHLNKSSLDSLLWGFRSTKGSISIELKLSTWLLNTDDKSEFSVFFFFFNLEIQHFIT